MDPERRRVVREKDFEEQLSNLIALARPIYQIFRSRLDLRFAQLGSHGYSPFSWQVAVHDTS